MKMGFIMDPIEQVGVFADTTFAFMLAAQARGHEVYDLRMADLAFDRGQVHSVLRPCQVRQVPGDHYTHGPARYSPLAELDVVFMRKDPPFDVAYLHATHYLALVEAQGTLVVNRPRGLQLANEKLFTLYFQDLMPKSVITRDAKRIMEVVEELGGQCIVKPIDGHGGEGIFMLSKGDRNAKAIIEALTRHGQEAIICQEYLPAIRQGDKRIIMLNGQPLGGVLRVPREDDHRGNMHVGGQAHKAELTPRDLEICAAVGPRLVQEGLYFVGLDVIGDHLTEINVTSPTGIQEMSRLNGIDGADQVIAWAEQRRLAS